MSDTAPQAAAAAAELVSPKTGERIRVPGREEEIDLVGHRVKSKVWDHRNGTYTCEFTPSKVGWLCVEVDYVVPGREESVPLQGSPWYPLVNSLPEWEVADVCAFVERAGFPELVRIFELRGVDGMALSALTEMSMEEELALTNKSLQRTLLYLIAQEMRGPLHLEAVDRVDELSLGQLGILDKKARERIVGFLEATTEKSSDVKEREEVRKVSKET
jgi:hypothetical protein